MMKLASGTRRVLPSGSGWPGEGNAAQASHELEIDPACRETARVIDDNSSHIAKGLDGMRSIWRNNRGTSGTSDPGLTGYRDLKLAIDDIPDLIIGMRMFMDSSASRNRVIREGHVRGVEEASSPTLARFLHAKSICIDERHNLTTHCGSFFWITSCRARIH